MEHGEPGHSDLERERFERAYEELAAAIDDEQRLSNELGSLLKSSQTAGASERTAFHDLADKMDKAQARSREVLARWLQEVERL